jgi:acetyl esterase/lipase
VDGAAPGAPPDRFVDQVGRPTLSRYRPENPDGSAVILAPGGGYVREYLDREAGETAQYLAARGVTAFVLRYRLPGEGWQDRPNVPLQDAQRAMRLVRAGAARFGLDPLRVGFMGFSAGGHVSASLATRFGAKVYDAVDGADAIDARPAFCGLLYPVVTMGAGAHIGSRDHLLGPDPSPDQIAAYSCEKHVSGDAPPAFLCLAADDPLVPPLENSLAMFAAVRAAKVPTEMHVFEEGGHGFGIARMAGKPGAVWPDLFMRWGAAHGFFRAKA